MRSLIHRAQRARNASDMLYQQLSQNHSRTTTLACDKGVSGLLNVLPLEDEGFSLNGEEFRDALALRYDKYIPDLPRECPCGKSFNPNQAMDYKEASFTRVTIFLEI